MPDIAQIVVIPKNVIEGSTSFFTISLLDRVGAPVVPDSLSYRIDCEMTGSAIVPLTSLSAASSSVVEVTPQSNSLVDQDNSVENKIITVFATLGDGQQTAEAKYIVSK